MGQAVIFFKKGMAMKISKGFVLRVMAVLALWCAGTEMCQSQTQSSGGKDYEPAPVLKAGDLLPATMLQDLSYRIMDEVKAENMMCNFSVWSRSEWYRPGSLELLYVRLAEIKALEELDQLQRDPQFIAGVKENAQESVQGVKQVLKAPMKSAAAVPKSMGKTLGGLWARINEEEGSRRGEETKMGFLYAKEKRKLAGQLGVDPDSDNQALQQALNTVAAHRNFGQMTVRLGASFVPGVAGTVMVGTQLNKNMQLKLLDSSPAELQQHNGQILKELGCPQPQLKAFLTNSAYSPANQTIITAALQDLKEVKDIGRYLECIQFAPKIETVLFYQRNIQMAQAYHQRICKLASMAVATDLPVYTDTNGKRVVFLSVDCLFWNAWVDRSLLAARKSTGGTGGELWISGQATALAKQHLAEKNVTVQDRVAEKLWGNQ